MTSPPHRPGVDAVWDEGPDEPWGTSGRSADPAAGPPWAAEPVAVGTLDGPSPDGADDPVAAGAPDGADDPSAVGAPDGADDGVAALVGSAGRRRRARLPVPAQWGVVAVLGALVMVVSLFAPAIRLHAPATSTAALGVDPWWRLLVAVGAALALAGAWLLARMGEAAAGARGRGGWLALSGGLVGLVTCGWTLARILSERVMVVGAKDKGDAYPASFPTYAPDSGWWLALVGAVVVTGAAVAALRALRASQPVDT